MITLSTIGRIFYGIAIAEAGLQTIYYNKFPYMLLPPKHPSFAILNYTCGALLVLAGICIIFQKKIKPVSLLLGSVLLLIFCFYFVPYELIANPNYMQYGEWENAQKELALAAGAFVIAGCSSQEYGNPVIRFLAKLIPLGTILFSLTMISFGMDHFLYAKDAADYVPSWIPNHLFWIYFAGVALLGSGLAIILKIKPRLNAILLGTMIFTWFLMLHIPYVVASSVTGRGGEITSAFIALAYSGMAFVIADSVKKPDLLKNTP